MRKETLRSGIVALSLLMTCMASTRVIGMVVDGEPNTLMFIYLLLELVAMAICLRWLKVVKAE
jgi:hypothetical protein